MASFGRSVVLDFEVEPCHFPWVKQSQSSWLKEVLIELVDKAIELFHLLRNGEEMRDLSVSFCQEVIDMAATKECHSP